MGSNYKDLVNISKAFTSTQRLVDASSFAVNNVGPSDIRLRSCEPTFTIFFSQVDGEVGSPLRSTS